MNVCGDIPLPTGTRDISPRRWVVFFVVFVAVAGAALLVARRLESPGHLEMLLLFLLYMSVAFTFCPLPTTWIILWAAREADPLLIALIGAAGTCIANMHDYYIINYLSGLHRARRFKESSFYRSSAAWFAKAPFPTLAVASFLPFPIDVVRALAVSTGYAKLRYVLATFAGRFPRYLLLAYIGYELKPSNRVILAVLLATAAFGAVKGLVRFRKRNDSEADR